MSHPDMLVHRFFLDVRTQDEVLRHAADTNNEWSPDGEKWNIDFDKILTLEEGLWLTQNAIIRPIGFTRESVADIQAAADSVNGVFQVQEEEVDIYTNASTHWMHATNPTTPNSLFDGQRIKTNIPIGRGLIGAPHEWIGVYHAANRTIVREGITYNNLNKFLVAHYSVDRPGISGPNAWINEFCFREVSNNEWAPMSDFILP